MDQVELHRGLAAAAFVAVAAVTVAIVQADPELALAGGSDAALGAELAAATLVLVAAVCVWRRGSAAPVLLAAAAVAWLIAEWNSPAAGPAFTPGLALYAVWPALLAAAALRGLDERPFGLSGRLLLSASFAVAAGVLGFASAAVFDPLAQGCAQCPANVLRVGDDPNLLKWFGRTGLALTAAWAVAFAVLGTLRLLRSSPARRWIELPPLVPAIAAVTLFAADALHSLDRGFVSNDPTDRTMRLAEAAALALVAAGVAVVRLRTRRRRATLAQLVLDVGAAPAPGELRARLADSLGDPTLQLLYRLEEGTWVGVDGKGAEMPTGRTQETTVVRAGGEDVLAIAHRPGLLDDPTLVAELATTASLALQHERLHAARRAHLEELRASRARIVAAADEGRRTLERDLHDGAQQRLVAVALAVQLERRRLSAGDPDLDTGLAAAEAGIRTAVAELRELAHGLFPTVLADEGLRAALQELSEHAPRLVPRALPSRRFPTDVESAAYFAASEALRLTDREVTIDALDDSERLRLVIGTTASLDASIVRIRDRVGAVGGTVESNGSELRLEMPCVS